MKDSIPSQFGPCARVWAMICFVAAVCALLVACTRPSTKAAANVFAPPPMQQVGPWPPDAKVYLLPIGKAVSYSLQEFETYYRQMALPVEILPPMAFPADTMNRERNQASAQALVEAMKRAHPQHVANPSIYMIGVVEQDIYMAGFSRPFTFNWRQPPRFGVISVARLKAASSDRTPTTLSQARLRKLISKNIALLYMQLPLSMDPSSLLYGYAYDVAAIDDMTERITGRDGGWAPKFIGGDPFVTVVQPVSRPATWFLNRSHVPLPETSMQSYVIDVYWGMFIHSQTDFQVPELPVAFTRSYRPVDDVSRAFGIGANHSLDMFLVGDAQKFSYLELVREDGGRIRFQRTSPGTSYADGVFQSTDGYGPPFGAATIRWNGNGWTMQCYDGWTYVFPSGAGAQRMAQAAALRIFHSDGRSFDLPRDGNGNLLRVVHKGVDLLRFAYDDANRVTRINDKNGREVIYRYDALGRLGRVSTSDGMQWEYGYDSRHQMREVKDAAGNLYVANEYDGDSRLVRQTLPGGHVFRYKYRQTTSEGRTAVEAAFLAPDGSIRAYVCVDGGYIESLPVMPGTKAFSAEGNAAAAARRMSLQLR